MATPRASVHRDLEQRLRDVEQEVQTLTGRALRRERLEVTSGDFEVSGGGDVVVRDGGEFRALYPTGLTAVQVGIFAGANTGTWLQMIEEDGTSNVFQVYRIEPNGTYPAGLSSLVAAVDTLILSSRGDAQMSGDTVSLVGAVNFPSIGTTGSAANLRITSAGNVLEVLSSRRYKAEIKDAPNRAEALLSVKGRTWRDRGERAADTKTRHVGYIAEELDAAGLTEYVDYDDQGRPNAIQYDRLTVPLLQLAQRQQAQLDDLTARLEALESAATR